MSENNELKVIDFEVDTEIRYIYHISDIHIRINQRHLEYKKVFEKVYKLIDNDIKNGIIKKTNAIIVLTGDILHSKTELSPECVSLTSELFKNLSSRLPVILIPGNHDCNLSNKQRMDALSPIVQDINTMNNFYYIRNTGIYMYGNIIFGATTVFTTLDLKTKSGKGTEVSENLVTFEKIEELVDNLDNKYTIALYHGPVHGAETDVGARMNVEELTAKDFKGYDYVLLGDIHKYQYMSVSEKKKDNRIAYAGSLIQQSHGENINGHGVLFWDIKKGTSKHIEIPNDYGYCTIKVVNGKVVPTTIPKYPRIRFSIKNTNNTDYNKILTDLQEKYKVQEIVKKIEIDNETNGSENDDIEQINFNDPKQQESFLEDYLRNNLTLDDKLVKDIIKLHKQTLNVQKVTSSATDSLINKMQKWKIIKLKFNNMLSYGENNEIDFTKYSQNSIIGIMAPNHYGKSAIIDILLFCLFDKFSRGDRKDILNKNKNKFYCMIEFKIGNQIYQIERIGQRQKKSVKIDVNFYQFNDSDEDEYINLSGVDKNETNNKITQYIGTYDDYVNTYFSLQNKNNNFIDMTQLERKNFLYQLLRINYYEELNNIAKEKTKENNGAIKYIEENILSKHNLSELEYRHYNVCELMYHRENDITECENIDKSLKNEKEVLEQKLNKISYDEDEIEIKIEKFNKKKEIINENLYSLGKKLKVLTKDDNDEINIDDTENELKILKNKRCELEKKIEDLFSKKKYIDNNYSEDDIEHYNKELKNKNSELSLINEKILSMKKIKKYNKDELMKKYDKYEKKCNDYLVTDNIANDNNNNNDEKMLKLLDKMVIIYNDIKIYNSDENQTHIVNENHLIHEIESLKAILNNPLIEDINNLHFNEDCKECEHNLSNLCKYYSDSNESMTTNINNKILKLEEKLEKYTIYKKNSDLLNLIFEKFLIEYENNKSFTSININNDINKMCNKIYNYYKNKSDHILDILNSIDDYNEIMNTRNIITQEIESINNKINKIKNIINIMNENDSVDTNINKVKSKIKEIDSLIEDYNILIEKHKTYDMDSRSIEIKKIKLEINNNNEIIINLENELEELNNKKSIAIKNKQIIEKIQKINNKINNNSIKLQIDREKYRDYIAKHDALVKQIKELKRIENELNIREYNSTLYKHYLKAIHQNGLPYEILKKYIPKIESDINHILSSIVNFTVSFVFKDEDDDKKINDPSKGTKNGQVDINLIYSGKEPYAISLSSGFEKFIVGLAIRMTLSNISMISQPNMMVIDEGWSCFDSTNLGNVNCIMNYLRNQFDYVIIISHLDQLKGEVDEILQIEKKNNYSFVTNIEQVDLDGTD
jgi:DNA repair exonuclease SbcCD ATPase subunit